MKKLVKADFTGELRGSHLKKKMRGGLPKIRTPRDHYEPLLRAKLIARRRAGGRSRTGRLGSAQVSLGLILGEIEHDDLVRSARALHVKRSEERRVGKE